MTISLLIDLEPRNWQLQYVNVVKSFAVFTDIVDALIIRDKYLQTFIKSFRQINQITGFFLPSKSQSIEIHHFRMDISMMVIYSNKTKKCFLGI